MEDKCAGEGRFRLPSLSDTKSKPRRDARAYAAHPRSTAKDIFRWVSLVDIDVRHHLYRVGYHKGCDWSFHRPESGCLFASDWSLKVCYNRSLANKQPASGPACRGLLNLRCGYPVLTFLSISGLTQPLRKKDSDLTSLQKLLRMNEDWLLTYYPQLCPC